MAVKGTQAKENVKKNIIESFNKDYIGENSNKLYVWADDGGQKVQIAISLTCPKVGLDVGGSFVDDDNLAGTYTGEPVIEITPEEEENIQTLIKKLNL